MQVFVDFVKIVCDLVKIKNYSGGNSLVGLCDIIGSCEDYVFLLKEWMEMRVYITPTYLHSFKEDAPASD